MTKKSDPATREDVERIVNKVVTEVVGEVATEILNAMAERFDHVEGRLTNVENSVTRIENILRPTVDKVDDHAVRNKRLEAKPA